MSSTINSNDENHQLNIGSKNYNNNNSSNKYLSNNAHDLDRINSLSCNNGLVGKRHSAHAVFSFTDFDVCVDEMDLLIENSTNAFLSVFKS